MANEKESQDRLLNVYSAKKKEREDLIVYRQRLMREISLVNSQILRLDKSLDSLSRQLIETGGQS